MLGIVLAFLVILFIFGYIDIPAIPLRDISLFNLFGKIISLYDLLIFLIILWVIEVLPWPFRGLAMVLLVLWLLSFFGIIVISGFGNIIVLTLIVGMIAYIFRGIKMK